MEKLRKAPPTARPNSKLIPATAVKLSEENVQWFNEIVAKYRDDKKFHRIIRSRSNGISLSTRFPAFDVRRTRSGVELTVIEIEGLFRLQIRNLGSEPGNHLSGAQAFKIFRETCFRFGVNLEDYAIADGSKVKESIEKYMIALERPSVKDHIFKEKAHHIDFHSAFPSGLIATHPEFTEAITHLYNGRDDHPEYKEVLNMAIGYMQSRACCKAKWAALSKDSINENNRRVREIASRLRESGRIVIAYNTDGIWYYGEVYHGQGEGDGLGEWSNDHINCTLRYKGPGAYEFIEDGNYTPVVRGRTRLDDYRPRDQWHWGDIYDHDAQPSIYYYDEETMQIKRRDDYGEEI